MYSTAGRQTARGQPRKAGREPKTALAHGPSLPSFPVADSSGQLLGRNVNTGSIPMRVVEPVNIFSAGHGLDRARLENGGEIDYRQSRPGEGSLQTIEV